MNHILRRNVVLGLMTVAVLPCGSWGCGSLAGLLPDSVNLSLPDDSMAEAQRGSGVKSLAQSHWQFYDGESNLPMFVAQFDENGAIKALTQNRILGADIFGSTLYVDGQTHATAVSGLTYSAVAYGAENGSGFAVQARAVATFGGANLGNGKVNVVGWPNEGRLEGTFDYSFTVQGALASMLPANVATKDRFPFYAERVK